MPISTQYAFRTNLMRSIIVQSLPMIEDQEMLRLPEEKSRKNSRPRNLNLENANAADVHTIKLAIVVIEATFKLFVNQVKKGFSNSMTR